VTETLLVAGTASHVGKSTVAAGLCRLLADHGVDVAPFKAQNMSNNAQAAPTPDGGWGEIGVSQFVQARAARRWPTTDANPVLLKPRGEGESQVLIDGRPVGHFAAADYYDDHWQDARAAAVAAYERLAAEHDVIVAEGAGSIAEPNLSHRDLANVECARFADARILLVTDIERGGAFASVVGTFELLPDDLRERVEGICITKFRGDRSLLAPGIETLEERTGVPVLGVVPHDDPGLPEEDSVDLPPPGERRIVGADDGVPADQSVLIAVPRLPGISNFTDLAPLAREPGVRVVYTPLDDPIDAAGGGGAASAAPGDGPGVAAGDAGSGGEVRAGDPADALVLPGTKNTVDDLLALREAGADAAIATFEGPIVGICGGYQCLGERVTNAGLEGTSDRDGVPGLGLLPVETRFASDKRVERVTRTLDGQGPIAGAAGTATGYEIHAGRTTVPDDLPSPLGPGSAATDRVLGTYLHGLFETDAVRTAFLDRVFAAAGKVRPAGGTDRQDPFDAAADLVRGTAIPEWLADICVLPPVAGDASAAAADEPRP
jgi:adenosylcobyric acid synthase